MSVDIKKYLDEQLSMFDNQEAIDMAGEQEKEAEKQVLKSAQPVNLFDEPFKRVQTAGNELLTGTIKGVTGLAQIIPGIFNYLESNKSGYQGLYNAEKMGPDKQFTGNTAIDSLLNIGNGLDLKAAGQFAAEAVGAGIEHGRQVTQSKTLDELFKNTISGVDLLKNMPGATGEYWKNAEKSKSGSIAAGVIGFGLEVLLDPTAKVGKAAYKGASAVASSGQASKVLGTKGADLMGRAAANLATGNVIGGAVAMTAREGITASKSRLLQLSNKYQGRGVEGKLIDGTLKAFFGPTQLMDNSGGANVMMRYLAQEEELPKAHIQLGEQTFTAISRKPIAQQQKITAELNNLVVAKNVDEELNSLEKLKKLGMDTTTASKLAQGYLESNIKLIKLIEDASEIVPELGKVTSNLTEHHVKRSLRLMADPVVKETWLDYLYKVNTPGSIQLKQSALRDNLLQGLGIKPDSDVLNPTKNKYDFTTGDELTVKAFSKSAGPGRIEAIRSLYENAAKTVDTQVKSVFRNEATNLSITGLDDTVLSLDSARQALMESVDSNVPGVGNHIQRIGEQITTIQKSLTGGVKSSNLRQAYRVLDESYRNLRNTEGVDQLAVDNLKQVIDNFSDKIMTPKMKKLQDYIDQLDTKIESTGDSKIDSLVAQRDKFVAMLDDEMSKVNISPGTPLNMAGTSRLSESGINTESLGEAVTTLDAARQQLISAATQLSNTPNSPQIQGIDNFIEYVGGSLIPALQRQMGSSRKPELISTYIRELTDFQSGLAKAAEGIDDPAVKDVMNLVDTTVNSTRSLLFGDNTLKGAKAQQSFGVGQAINHEMVAALKASGVSFNPNVMEAKMRMEFADDLHAFIQNNDDVIKDSIVGFKPNETGEWIAERPNSIKATRNTTLGHLQKFTADWGRARNLTEEQLGELNAAMSNSLLYVPGSREFVTMFQAKGKALMNLDDEAAQAITSTLNTSSIDLSSIDPRTLPEEWLPLYGHINDFAVNAADEGISLGKIAADAQFLKGLRQAKVLVTAAELGKDPELMLKEGWKEAGTALKGRLGDEQTQYYIRHADELAISAMDRAINDEDKYSFLASASNLFRRNALKWDPSSHVTQFLGNISMLQMMGMQDMFGKNVDLVGGMGQAYKSVVLGDDAFQDAVDAGVAINQTILNQQQKANFIRTAPTLRIDGQGKSIGLKNIFLHAESMLKDNARAAIDTAAKSSPGDLHHLEKQKYASTHTDAGAMLQLSDQMTRLFAYNSALKSGVQELVKSNPVLANFTQSGTRINWESLEKHIAAGARPGYTMDEVQVWKEAHQTLRTEAAKLANDVALNYHDTPQIVNFVSRTGIVPFIKFQWKATGRFMELIDEKPWAFSPYFAAQRNINDSMNIDPDKFEEQKAALSPSVRNSFVVPTGGKDSMGRVEFVDFSRWLPFGMFATGDQTGDMEGGLSQNPNSLVSMPIFETVANLVEGKPAPGQSYGAWAAQQLATTFLPSTIAPGGRRLEALANSIEASKFYVDVDGNVHSREPLMLERGIVAAANIPEQAGHAVQTGLQAMAGKSMTESAKGVVQNPNAPGVEVDMVGARPRTTVEQAGARFIAPGVGFSSDAPKTANELSKKYEFRQKDLMNQRNNLAKRIQNGESLELQKQIDRIDMQLNALEAQRQRVIESLTVGE